MKKIIRLALVATILATAAFNASAWDLKNVLKGNNDSTQTSLGGVITGVINTVTSQKPTIEELTGTWKYSSPAVVFQSENLLKKAGGAAASKQLEDKLSGIYAKSGITGMTITFNNDSTFVMSVKKIKAQGTITMGDDGNYIFHFKAIGKVNVGQMTAYIVKTGTDEVSLTFDASKLIVIVEKIAQFSNNSTLKAASAVLDSYDGATVGFKIKK
ncbi:MAG: DUF4923 family protein [Muribaculaceae bacterium]|nr:DUF4923 family protein [Muribaculaceae bacterium]